MKNVLTVDLEDWFSVETLHSVIDRNEWVNLDSSICGNTETILDLFRQYNIKATFFVLGWIADRYPKLVADVADEGHEIACHSYYHRMANSLTPQEFTADTARAVDAIVKACNRTPVGYRSPSWGMQHGMEWAFEILHKLGFKYDSSIFPIRHDIYGDPSAPQQPFEIQVGSGKSIIEIPATTMNIFGRRFPVGGGGWLRQFPYWFTRWGIRRLNRSGVAAMVYFHPWELDPNIPRVKMEVKNKIRQYGNLNTMRRKVERLLNDFDFVTVSEYIDTLEF